MIPSLSLTQTTATCFAEETAGVTFERSEELSNATRETHHVHICVIET